MVVVAGGQKLAGFRQMQKMPSIHSLGAYLLFGTKNVVFACITQIATKKTNFCAYLQMHGTIAH